MADLRPSIIFDLDRESERILLELQAKIDTDGIESHGSGGGRLHTGALARAVGFNNTGSAKYRLEEKLVPAGLVNRVGKRHDGGSAPVDWELTVQGREWVEKHQEALEAPKTPEEAIDVARDAKSVADQAQSAAGSANDSVRRLREEFDELEDDVEATWSAARDARDQAKNAANKPESVTNSLHDKLKETINQRVMDATEDEFHNINSQIEEMTNGHNDMVDAHNKLLYEFQDLQDQYIYGLDRTVSRLISSYQVKAEKLENLREENRKLQDRVDNLESKIEDLGEDVNEMQGGLFR